MKIKKKASSSTKKNSKQIKFSNSNSSGFYIKSIFLVVLIFFSFRLLFSDLFNTLDKLNTSLDELGDVRWPTKIYKEIERASNNPLSDEEIDKIGNLILTIYKNDIEKILKPLNEYKNNN